jgi:hypothetical protein
VRDYLDQANMFGSDISPEARVILENLDEYRRSSKKIGTFMGNLADTVQALGDPRQASAMPRELPSKGEAVAEAAPLTAKQLQDSVAKKNAGLFEDFRRIRRART